MPLIFGRDSNNKLVPILVDSDGKIIMTAGAHDLLDGNIDQDTVANTVAEGDIIVGIDQGGGSILWDVLAAGTDGQVLTVQADGSLAWATPSGGGGATKLAQVAVGAGGQATIDFTSISQAYDTLVIDYLARSTYGSGASDDMRLICNNVSTGVYDHALFQLSSSGLVNNIAYNQTYLLCGYLPVSVSTASFFSGGRIVIPNYANANVYKDFQARTTWQHNITASYYALYDTALKYKQTTAISRLTFSLGNGNFDQYSTFTLFGL